MKDATGVLKAYMAANKIAPSYELGQLTVALEVVSLIRTLESIPVVSVAEKEGTIATLHTLLRESQLESAYEAYDALAEWRRVKFVGVSVYEARGIPQARRDTRYERLWAHPNQELCDDPKPGQLALPFEEG